METSSLSITAAASAEPVTLAQAKKHLELSQDDTTHDEHLALVISAAREQLEHDTGLILAVQQYVWKTSRFVDGMEIPRRPVTVSSVKYYDEVNTLQTLNTSLYTFDAANSRIYLAYDEDWPDTVVRWDAVQVFFSGLETVPTLAKQAILLQVGKWFSDRDMQSGLPLNNLQVHDLAYERIVKRLLRRSYP